MVGLNAPFLSHWFLNVSRLFILAPLYFYSE